MKLFAPPGASVLLVNGNKYVDTGTGVTFTAFADIGAAIAAGWVPPTQGSGKTAARRNERLLFDGGSLITAPAWGASTAYGLGKCVQLPGGQLIGVAAISGTGTSGASAPTFSSTTEMIDNAGANQIIWMALGRQSKAAPAGLEVPTVSVPSTLPTGKQIFQFLNFTAGTVHPNALACAQFPVAPNLVASSSNLQQWLYDNGSTTTINGMAQGLQAPVQMAEFVTEDASPAIAFYSSGGNGPIVYVGDPDGQKMYRVEESPKVVPIVGGNVSFYQMTWPSGRASRRYRVEFTNGGNSQFYGLCLDPQSRAYPPPNFDGLRGIMICDSYGLTTSPGGNLSTDTFGTLPLKYAGIRYNACTFLNGAGYVAGSAWRAGANAATAPLVLANNSFAGFPADVVVFALGYNDWTSSPAAVTAAALQCFQRARQIWPTAKLIIFGPQVGTHLGGSAANVANVYATEAAVLAAYQQYQTWFVGLYGYVDTDSKFHPFVNDPAGPLTYGSGYMTGPAGTVSFVGSCNGNVLTVASVSSGTLAVGMMLNNGTDYSIDNLNFLPNTFITGQLTGTVGGAGTYSVNKPQVAVSSAGYGNYGATGGPSDFHCGSDQTHPTALYTQIVGRWKGAIIDADLAAWGM